MSERPSMKQPKMRRTMLIASITRNRPRLRPMAQSVRSCAADLPWSIEQAGWPCQGKR